MNYIRLPKVYEKLKKAEEFYAPVIMTAASGYGKSAAANYYYRRKKPLIIKCSNKTGDLNAKPEIQTLRSSVVIVEDLQWLSEESGIRYLKKLLQTPGRQIVMLTRGAIPTKQKALRARMSQVAFCLYACGGIYDVLLFYGNTD